jgi:hypothetical protein
LVEVGRSFIRQGNLQVNEKGDVSINHIVFLSDLILVSKENECELIPLFANNFLCFPK